MQTELAVDSIFINSKHIKELRKVFPRDKYNIVIYINYSIEERSMKDLFSLTKLNAFMSDTLLI